jgi:hypothetical protein
MTFLFTLKNLLLFFTFINLFSLIKNEPNLVLTKYGYIKGFNDSFSSLYLGIPFAQAPVDKLRWKEPLDVQPWSPNILNATKAKPACPQINCSKFIPAISCPIEVFQSIYFFTIFLVQFSKIFNLMNLQNCLRK